MDTNIATESKTHPQIKEALLYLSGHCNGASTHDGQGFNKVDAAFGKSLAEQCEQKRLSDVQQRAALKMLRKYVRQLEAADIYLPPIEERDPLPELLPEVDDLSPENGEVKIAGPSTTETTDRCTQLNGKKVPQFFKPHLSEIETEQELELNPISVPFHLLKESVSLNQQQKRAIALMWDFYHREPVVGKPSFFLLEGHAGVGKTFVIQQFVRLLQESGKRPQIVMSSPTNKATQVLERMASKAELHNIDFATIFQLLGLKLIVDDDGKEKVEADPNGHISIDNYDLVLLDEASMVSSSLWNLIKGNCRGGEPKIIFLGDPNQLPPVGEVESKVFDIGEGAQLTQTMRFGSVIGELVTEVRDRIYEKNPVTPYSISSDDSDEQVLVMDKYDWLSALVEDFKSDAYKANPDYVRALAWTNKAVSWLNTYVRQAVHGLNAPQFIPGERLIALRPVTEPDFKGKSVVVMTTSSECEVFEVKEIETLGFKVWQMWVTTDAGRRVRVNCISDESRSAWLQRLEAIKQQAFELERGTSACRMKWKEYYDLKNSFAPLTYAYATTTHKSQGSTFSHVYVALADLMRNTKVPERGQLCYVAYSRAAHKLFIAR